MRLIGILDGRLACSSNGWITILEPGCFFVQEPQVNSPKEKIQKSKYLLCKITKRGLILIEFVLLLLLTIDMLRPAKFPEKSGTQPALSLQILSVFNQALGSDTYFTAETPEAQAALPDSQKTASTIVTRKSFKKTKLK